MTNSMIPQETSIFREISILNPKYLEVKTPTISMIRKNLGIDFVNEPLKRINVANLATKSIDYIGLLELLSNHNDKISVAN